ncbi:MAG TPA: hypothetical protein VFK94_05355 [Patescibacteria group bacterium]|nr:hypothetical protein [Patescibacteria group bacterium]
MPENIPATDQTVTPPPAPTEPVVTSVSPEPAPVKKSNTFFWMIVLAVITLVAVGGAYLYTQGYFGTSTETPAASTDGSTETAAIDAELASTDAEISALEADLVQFESDGGSF